MTHVIIIRRMSCGLLHDSIKNVHMRLEPHQLLIILINWLITNLRIPNKEITDLCNKGEDRRVGRLSWDDLTVRWLENMPDKRCLTCTHRCKKRFTKN